MRIGRILSPITALGPGRRIGIWFQGCSKKCKNCISPEFQSYDNKKNIPLEVLVALIVDEINRHKCDGITISGGEPFDQNEELLLLLKGIKGLSEDILVYTGYQYEHLYKNITMRECLNYIDVLIDGPYVDERNIINDGLRGSDNQRIIYLNESVRDRYEEYISEGRKLQSFMHQDKVVVVGIQNRSK